MISHGSKLFFSLILVLFISACSTMSKSDFDATITQNRGQSVDLLVQSWGPPTGSYRNQDGSMVYQWARNGGSQHFLGDSYPWIGAGSHAYAPWNHALWPAWHGGIYNSGISMVVSRPMMLDRSCTVTVTTDTQNRIVGHNSVGEACGSEY